jgi:EpsD family peptidyl-prolyl cis-trans isomerase
MLKRSRSLAGRSHLMLAMGLCAVLLAGCGKKEQGAAGSSGQVVAHVGDEVVTTQELENEFRWANIPPEKQKDPAIVKQVLGELVLRKYLLQQAVSAKLDREPGVLLDLLRARTQVLASAYVSRSISTKPITQTEVERYIANNPLKFAKRQILTSEQMVFQLNPNSQAVVDDNRDAKSLDEVDEKLSILGVPHSRASGTLSTSDIPEDLYNVIEAKKSDNVFFVRSGPNGIFFTVRGEEPRPLEGEAANNTARLLLRAERIKSETAMAAYSANLDAKYEGEYASIMGKSGDQGNK